MELKIDCGCLTIKMKVLSIWVNGVWLHRNVVMAVISQLHMGETVGTGQEKGYSTLPTFLM
jgi:hypothetical protein